jgi:hypothetical protein
MNPNEWKPHKKQAEFLSLPFSIKEAFYGGGAGSAKTETLLMYGIIHKLHENPRFKQLFLRRTFPELRNEVVPRSKYFYSKLGAEFNKSTMTWTFPSGAIIMLGHCENEDDVHQYDSTEISLFTPDELTSDTEWIYLYIGFERVRAPLGSGLPSIIRAAGMPGGIGHSWVKKRFVDPYPKGGKLIIGKGGNKRIYIHATLADNPHIDPTYSQSLEALPEAEKQAKKFGSWDAYLGQVFEEFRDKHYPDEPDNALHVVEPFDIPEFWPRLVSIDWGFAPPAMTSVGYFAISPNRRVYLYREQSWQKTKIEEYAGYIREWIDKEDPRIIKLCKSAGQDRGQEHTIHQQVESALGRAVQLTTNTPGSRIAGKQLIHEYLRWKKKFIPPTDIVPYNEVHSQWLLRNRGLKEYEAYLNNYLPVQEETNLPKLIIFKTCPNHIDAIKSCSYDKTNPEDVAEFPGDDPYDDLRYGIDACDKFFDESVNEFERLQKTENLVKQLQETQDWTSFYRNARKLDTSEVVRPIARYHHHA